MSCRKGDALHPAIGRVKTCLDGRAVQGGTVGLDGGPGLPQAFVSLRIGWPSLPVVRDMTREATRRRIRPTKAS